MRIPLLLLPLALALLTTTGCVTGQRTMDLSVPKATGGANKGQVSVRLVTDERRFENDPDAPSTPSARGGIEKLSPSERGKLIGRQRNGYGMAMGDIALSGGQTVPGKVRELVREGFAEKGYVVTTSGASNSADVHVEEFWAWMSPGMWSLGFDARIKCRFTVSRGGSRSSFTVAAHGKNGGQVAKNANWQQAYEEAFAQFQKQLAAELTRAGF